MIFSLGFLIAGLLSLLFLPAFWRRAMRLSMRRLEMLTPLSMDEVLAERDQLRAQAAVDVRRIEQKLEAAREDRARHMSEIGRRASVIAQLEGQIEDVREALRAREAELSAAWAEMGILQIDSLDMTSRMRKTADDFVALRIDEARLREQFDLLRIEKSALELSVEALQRQDHELRQAMQVIQLELDASDATGAQLANERDFFRDEAESAAMRGEQLTAAVEELRSRVVELEESERTERRGRLSAQKDLEVVTKKLLADSRALAAQAFVAPATRDVGEHQPVAAVSMRATDPSVAQAAPPVMLHKALVSAPVSEGEAPPESDAVEDQINILRMRAGLRAATN